MRIGDFEIGSKCFIVAELAGNHNGSIREARHMIRTAQKCGADAVKLQTFIPEKMPDKDIILGKEYPKKWQGMTGLEFYHLTMMPWDDQLKLRDYARDLGIILFSTVCQPEAVDWWEKHGGLPAYKIASWQCQDRNLVRAVAATRRCTILSVCTYDELIHNFMHPNAYLVKDNLDELQQALEWPGKIWPQVLNIGYSNHSPIQNCIEAVKRGAVIVEQHFTLSRDTIDGKFAALPEQFSEMVKGIREWESHT